VSQKVEATINTKTGAVHVEGIGFSGQGCQKNEITEKLKNLGVADGDVLHKAEYYETEDQTLEIQQDED
jgi:hypothetical protein